MTYAGRFRAFRTFSALLVIIFVPLILIGDIRAVEKIERQRQGDEVLRETYERINPKLEKNSFGFPLYLESSDIDGRVNVDVYGIFEYPFDKILNAVTVPVNWCDIVALHPNIKACTYRRLAGSWELAFYLGRKVYQAPQDVYQFTYRYRNVEQKRAYLDIVLDAEAGPFGTKDHAMKLEAMPLSDDRSFVRVGYAYSYGFPFRLAQSIYFATVGRDKEGFTVIGSNKKGEPIYIGGQRGAVERNAVRYYFAIQSFLDALRLPEEDRFNARLGEWYDLTMRYRKQLFEMEKKDYLTGKAKEHKEQVRLQKRILENPPY